MGKIVGLVFKEEQGKPNGNEPNVKDLKALLDEKGIVYDAKAKKADLLALLDVSQTDEGAGN